jgi:hypothetical protein
MKNALTIDRVDLDLLDGQRLTLAMAMFRQDDQYGTLTLNKDEVDALSGIVNMLDHWSDKQWEKANEA